MTSITKALVKTQYNATIEHRYLKHVSDSPTLRSLINDGDIVSVLSFPF